MSLQDFEFGKELGQGAFGSVIIAKRKEDGKNYAMKRVKISQLSQKERENALNEIRLLGSLSHINIIGYKEAFFDDNSKTINIVMELADDGDILSKIQENTRNKLSFEESTIWSILIQILSGMKYLHDNRIMHRDLKSANIFLMKSGFVKIGDMNVSKIAKMGMAKTQTGTPYYAAPEIWKDNPYDYKCDIWSIGCIIYEMCTSKPPFRGTSLPGLFQNIQKGIYDPIPKTYSKELSVIISNMLQVNPLCRMNCDDLLQTKIISDKLQQTQTVESVGKQSSRIELIKTIKIPKNMKEINSAMPKKRYKKQKEEMEAFDEFETKKKFFTPDINHKSSNKSQQSNKQPSQPNKQINLINNNKKNANSPVVLINNNNIYEKFGRLQNEGKGSMNKKDMNSDGLQKIQKVNDFLQKEKVTDNYKRKGEINSNIAAQRPVSGCNRKPIALQNKIMNNNNNLLKVNNNYPVRPSSGQASKNKQPIYYEGKASPRHRSSPNKNIIISGNRNANLIQNNNDLPKKRVIIKKINYQRPVEKKKVEHPYSELKNKNKAIEQKKKIIIKKK